METRLCVSLLRLRCGAGDVESLGSDVGDLHIAAVDCHAIRIDRPNERGERGGGLGEARGQKQQERPQHGGSRHGISPSIKFSDASARFLWPDLAGAPVTPDGAVGSINMQSFAQTSAPNNMLVLRRIPAMLGSGSSLVRGPAVRFPMPVAPAARPRGVLFCSAVADKKTGAEATPQTPGPYMSAGGRAYAKTVIGADCRLSHPPRCADVPLVTPQARSSGSM